MVMTIAIVVTAAVVIFGGLALGARQISPAAVVSALLWPDGKIDSIFVWTLRLPRSAAAFVAGAGLGVAGFLLQTLTRNPLAGPGITGVTSGAVAAIVLTFTFLPWVPSPLYPFIGMAGGIGAAVTTLWIAGGGTDRPLHLVLGGITVSLFLGAITTYILLLSGPQAPSLLFWLSGGFQGKTWIHLVYMTPWVVAGLLGAFALRRMLGMLMLDDHTAAGMGLQLDIWKPVLLILAVLPVAGIVPVAGPIAFVGLATPHIARLLRPQSLGWAIMLTAALGGLIVAAADIVSRTVAAPRELPVSIVTALIGGPIFIALIYRQQRLPTLAIRR